jgi:secretion/DNA translocation related TadE-like protein
VAAVTPSARSERGAATVLAVAFISVLVLVGAALAVVGAMVHAHRVAQSAADLGALAGADAIGDGRDPCTTAERITSANGAHLTVCRVDGWDVRVEVTVAGPRWLGQTHDLVAEARAGPAEAVP